MDDPERKRIEGLLKAGREPRAVAREVRRSPTTVYRIRREMKAGAARELARLRIVFDPMSLEDLGLKTLDGKPWQVACPGCQNIGPATANDCIAKLTLESGATLTGSRGPFYLNPIDLPYTLQRASANGVDVPPGLRRNWDLVFAPAVKEPSGLPITSGPVYMRLVPAEDRGIPPEEMDWGKGGACIGTPIAMTRRGVPQCHLLPGEYLARLEVYDQLGKKADGLFRIIAPLPGGKLEVRLAPEASCAAPTPAPR